MKKTLYTISAAAALMLPLAWNAAADGHIDIPGAPNAPAKAGDYKSHIFAAFDEYITCGADLETAAPKILKVVEQYPDEVNDIIAQDGVACTALESAVKLNDAALVKAMLDRGAIPFSYYGDESLISKHTSPEVAKLIREAQSKYRLAKMLLDSRNSACRDTNEQMIPTPDLPRPQATGEPFSRKPRGAYFDPVAAAAIYEYSLPPLCRDGVTTFYTLQFTVSQDARSVMVIRYRQQSPSPENRITISRSSFPITSPFFCPITIDGKSFELVLQDSTITGIRIREEGAKEPTVYNFVSTGD